MRRDFGGRAATAVVLVLSVWIANCGSGGSGGGGGGNSSGVIGQACSATSPCGAGLFCYAGDNSLLTGLCTTTCTASADTDSCIDKYPNTACLVAEVCGANCGNGLSCPPGAYCNTSYEVCVNASNSCPTAFDDYCDEPDPCATGTDSYDCEGI
ncbi:MAG: hypothetical protein IPI67_13245 [Myxococcales bacterium]|nr:hypothetical protein [Myxococcales bacterium]